MKQQNWEIKFDEKFNTIDHTGIIWGKNNKVTMSLEAIKQFIASLLEEQKKEFIKIVNECSFKSEDFISIDTIASFDNGVMSAKKQILKKLDK